MIARATPSGVPAALATSGAIVLQLCAIGAAFDADSRHVHFLGAPLDFTCSFHQQLGLPCPTCGVTRAIVLTLHGEFASAFALFPAAPIAVLGLTALAIALLVYARLAARSAATGAFLRRVRNVGLVYAGVGAVVWAVNYAWTLSRMVGGG